MKKYNLKNLYVIKIVTSNKIRNIICTKNVLFNTFTDVLTGERVNPFYPVEPLSKYYNEDKNLKLTKSDILHKYQEINESNKKHQDETTNKVEEYKKKENTKLEEQKQEEKEFVRTTMSQKEIDIKEELEKAIKDFFPESGEWRSNCFRRSKELHMCNLPCNLRNDKWLAKMLIKEKNLDNLNYYDVLDFVKKSESFKEARHNYELEIVKWQIGWIRSGGEGWISCEEYGGDAVFFTNVCDYGFRKGVLNTLLAIGMNEEVIEEGLEKYADMWRENYMKIAFHNEYEPVFFMANPDAYLEPVDEKHKKEWIRYRKYEYYTNHKRVVDKYANPDSDMLMSPQEARQVEEYLSKMHKVRKEQIEEYKKEAYAPGKTRTLWR